MIAFIKQEAVKPISLQDKTKVGQKTNNSSCSLFPRQVHHYHFIDESNGQSRDRQNIDSSWPPIPLTGSEIDI